MIVSLAPRLVTLLPVACCRPPHPHNTLTPTTWDHFNVDLGAQEGFEFLLQHLGGKVSRQDAIALLTQAREEALRVREFRCANRCSMFSWRAPQMSLFHRELSSQPILTVLTSCIKEWRFLESRLLYVSAASTAEMNVMSARTNVSGVSCGLSISSPVSCWSAP